MSEKAANEKAVSGEKALRIWVDDADVAAEAADLGRALGVALDVRIDPDPLGRAFEAEGRVGVWISVAPPFARLVELARRREGLGTTVVCAMPHERGARSAAGPASDLGFAVVDEVRPLVAALALLGERDEGASRGKNLPAIDRRRIERALEEARAPKDALPRTRLVRSDGHTIAAALARGDVPLGEPRDVALALAAIARAEGGGPPGRAVIDGIEARATLDILFGPPRALSDPASKAALAPYHLPMPLEELCSSPSRASAEAARLGFPVRVSLASPDLRSWDHPDLSVDGVSSASAVRDAFRQLTGLATERRPDARLLGVNVSATSTAIALLSIDARPLEHGASVLSAAFADPHGAAAGDATTTIIPSTPARLERALSRLDGRGLLGGSGAAERKALEAALTDLFLRVAAFLDAHGPAVTRLELRPLAILHGGRIEVREACVTVGDHYVRQLEMDTPRAS